MTTKKVRKIKNKTLKIKKSNINSNFDSGNIRLIKKKEDTYFLEINDDPYKKNTKKKFQYWFYFKVSNAKNKNNKYIIENIRSYFNDWCSFNVCYSYDNKTWRRCETFVNDRLTWTKKSRKNTIWFAYYVPYTLSRKIKMMNKLKNNNNVDYKLLGKTSLKNDIDMITIGNGKKIVWVVARQHPGESIGSWIMEGFLRKLLRNVKEIKEKFTFKIVMMANPDGVYLGRWYLTKDGNNTNINWYKNSNVVETKLVMNEMKKDNIYMVLDLHGDEGAPKHFLTKGKKTKVYYKFNELLNKYNSNFQLEDYYDLETPNSKPRPTLDRFVHNGITLEGSLKHKIGKNVSLEKEPLKIGSDIFKVFKEL